MEDINISKKVAGVLERIDNKDFTKDELINFYYNFDNKPTWFRVIWKVTDLIRRLICVLPRTFKIPITSVIAVFIYLPLARLSFALEIMGMDVSNVPLSDYRRKRFYIMRTDALDRFGTRLEKRFSKTL